MQVIFHNNNPESNILKVVVNDEVAKDLKDDEAVICCGIYCNKFPRPSFKTFRFSTTDLKASVFEEELVTIISAGLIQSANLYGWTTWD